MNYSKQVRKLKKQIKPVSKTKGMKRGLTVLNNAKITRKIYKLQRKYGHGVINHEYFKQIKKMLNTKSSPATVNKVKQLLTKNNNNNNQQTQAIIQKKIDSAIENYMNNHKHASAHTDISATNQDCLNLGKQVIKLIRLKHPTTELSIKDIQKTMDINLTNATQKLRKADATVSNKPKGEPPISNFNNSGDNQTNN